MNNAVAQIAAVARSLRTEDVDGELTRIQSLVQEYPAGIADVWDAVTSAERIPKWFMPISGELRLGGRYQLQGNAGGEILACVAPENGTAEYRVTWEAGGGVSWVVVRLTELEQHVTRFELEHAARVADVPAEMWDTYGPGATGVGWDGGLLGLAIHLGANDADVSPETAEIWGQSDEGKAFSRASADRWADAHVVAGAEPDVAARAADATYGFYTGQVPA